MKHKPRIWRKCIAALTLACGGLVFIVTCTSPPKLPDGVVKETHQLECAGERMTVDFYFRTDGEPAPQVVVAHGFSRGRRHMAGWGAALAERGMIAAVPTQPRLAAHARNGRALAALAEQGRAGLWPVAARGDGRTALAGFSMGGLTTLLAAASLEPPAAAWVGLDPVDARDLGAAAARGMSTPGLALLAEPAPCNAHGNAVAMLRHYGGPLRMLRVRGATHCDPEAPSDLLAQLACGRVNAGRQRLFFENAVGFLEAVLSGRGKAWTPKMDGLEPVALTREP